MKHVEMIIDYVVDGDDFQYSDNHGVLIRCRDCKYCDSFIKARSADGLTEHMEYRCKDFHASVMPDDYCSRGERRDV